MELRDVPHINDSDLRSACGRLARSWACRFVFTPGPLRQFKFPRTKDIRRRLPPRLQAITRPASTVSVLVNLLISKILMRFPSLKVVLAESGLGWGAYLLEYTDFQATGDQLPQNGYDLMPSEMFRRNCYLVGWYDQASLRVRSYIGSENILWSTQFPLATSTWPEYPKGSFQELRRY